MKIGIIGSGMVAQQLGFGLIKAGHGVKIGTRTSGKLGQWIEQTGDQGSVGNFADAAKFGEMLILATKWDGEATKNAIDLAGKANFSGKILIDVTNPLVIEAEGQAPKLAVGYPDSAGAIIQGWLPEAKVVKAFNIITAFYMANPKLKQGTPDMFIAGNDLSAKKVVAEIASNWGWEVIDMGGIEQSYLLEALALLWIRYGFLNNHWKHAFKLLKE
jgi:8-hydroxy-5-deazaflavin:NADPH oxidoreductase